MREIESVLKDKLRDRLNAQGVYVDNFSLDDLDKYNINLEEDDKESSDDHGSDSSADDGLPLHLERFVSVSFSSLIIFFSLSLFLLWYL